MALIKPTKKIQRGRNLTQIVFKDEYGFITGVWFNQAYIKKMFKVGEKVLIYGKINKRMGELQIVDPKYEKDYELNNDNNILPIYSTNRFLTQKTLRNIVKNALEQKNNLLKEFLPKYIKEKFDLLDLYIALENIHFPKDKNILNKSIYRLKFEELLLIQLGLQLFKKV